MKASWIAGLALGLAAAGCQRSDAETAAELRALRLELRAQRAPAETGADPADRGELRTALQPLQQAFEAVLARHETERSRWTTLAAEVDKLATLVGVRIGDVDKTALTELQARLAALEQSMQDERATQAQERELILKALEHTADKLDVFLQRVQRIEPASPPTQPANGDDKPEAGVVPPGAPRKEQADTRGMDLTLVLLGAALVLVLVAIVILFPGPLGRGRRTPVVQLRSRDDEDLTPELLAAMEAVVLEPDGGFDTSDDGPSPVVEVDDDPTLPWRIEQEMPCARPDVIGPMLHERLLQDPRVLVEPPPTVRAGSDSVTLRYHLAPHLTRAEADRLRTEVEILVVNGSNGGGPRNGSPAA